MHEMSLCNNLLEQVMSIAAQNHAQAVESITVNIGALAGVEPMLLESAFSIIKFGTIAENAQLIFQITPVTVFCLRCGTQSETAANRLLCGSCQSHETTMLSGDELILASVALQCAEE